MTSRWSDRRDKRATEWSRRAAASSGPSRDTLLRRRPGPTETARVLPALAPLAMLACAAGKGVSRDRVLSVLWAESETDRARHALAQTLYGLRRLLGTEVVRSTPELTLDHAKISSDLEAFRTAVRERNWSEAAELYVGPFLDGFYLSDAPEFERWVEQERVALATDGMRAIEAVATERSKSGDLDAAEHWRRLTVLDPFNA